MARQIVSLCVEDTSMKMLVFKGRQLKKWATMLLDEGLIKDAVILDGETLSEKIKEFLEINEVATKRVAVSVSGIHSVYQLLRLPKLSKELMDEAVMREAKRVMPVPLDDLYLSWKILDISEVEAMVCLVGLPRSTVDPLIDTLRRVGLSPYLMDIKPLAVARAVGEENAIVVDIDSVSFDIVIVIDGIPQLVQSMTFGEDVTSVDGKVAVIKEELDRTVQFYNSSHDEEIIGPDMPLFLAGEPDEVIEQLTQASVYRIKDVPEMLSFPQHFDRTMYLANLGLALKEIKVDSLKLRVDVNVMPEAPIKKQIPFAQALPVAFLGLGIVSLIALIILTSKANTEVSTSTAELANDVEHTQQLLEKRQLDLVDINERAVELESILVEIKAERDRVLQTLTYLKKRHSEITQGLIEVVRLLPEEIYLTKIHYGGGMTLEGVAPDWLAVKNYCDRLIDIHGFSEASILIDSFEAQDEGVFSFCLQLGYMWEETGG
jgi:type IV pilus assembly protein PilM